MPSVAGKKVLLFGDSLSAGSASPGAFLAARLTDRGAIVKVNAVVGRSAWNFYTARENAPAVIADCLAFKPDLVIVELGTNDIGLGGDADRAAMIKLRAQLAAEGAEVWAIGPPAMRALDSGPVAERMRLVFGPRFIDWRLFSRDMTSSPPRTADGVHFTTEGGKIAGQRLADEFLQAPGGGIGITGLVLVAVLAWAIMG